MSTAIEEDFDYTNETEAAMIAQLADRAASREVVDVVEGSLAVIITERGQTIHQFDLEQFGTEPARKQGIVTLSDPGSLVTYVNRHSLERSTTLWSDVDAGRIAAVLDDHCSHEADTTPGLPGWGSHRAVLTLRETPEWKHWKSRDGQWRRQDEFAEHIEDGVDAIREPDAATMLEVAQSFHATSGAKFASSKHLSGEIQFKYEEQTTAKAGQTGTMEIPQTFVLGLAPFDGNSEFPVDARFRFRLVDGALQLGYRLIRADRIRQQAFDEVISQVSLGTEFPVMAGAPRSS